jgi:hypothetical protein
MDMNGKQISIWNAIYIFIYDLLNDIAGSSVRIAANGNADNE